MRNRRFTRASDGALVVHLSPDEVALLRQLAGELTELLDDPAADDEVVQRLFPHAYLDPTEEEAEQEWQRLVRPDLVSARLEALRTLVDTLPDEPTSRGRMEARLDDEQEAAWVGVLNDARLTLGTRLGVTEEDDVTQVPPTDPSYVAWNVYSWLTGVQADLVRVLLDGLPRGGDDT
jgi:hypothetical protein